MVNKSPEAEESQARRELELNLDNWSARTLVLWWMKWYGRLGHRPLRRIMVEIGKSIGE